MSTHIFLSHFINLKPKGGSGKTVRKEKTSKRVESEMRVQPWKAAAWPRPHQRGDVHDDVAGGVRPRPHPLPLV